MDRNNPVKRTRASSHVEAAAWRAHFAETRTEEHEAFDRWLAVSSANREAWEHIQAPWDILTEQANSPQLIALRRSVLNSVHAKQRARARSEGRRRWAPYAWAAGVAMAVAGAVSIHLSNQTQVYRTATAETRAIELPDGSKLTLDSQTEINVMYSEHVRELRILRGQARFDVSPDPVRPFAVHANEQKIVALGTAFNVDCLKNKTFITLLEGRIAVTSPRVERPIELGVGEQLVVARQAMPKRQTVKVDQVSAWQNGQLDFENELLAGVVERINRHSNRTIEIADAETAGLKITGVFKAGDIDSFVATVVEYLPIEAERIDDGHIRLKKR